MTNKSIKFNAKELIGKVENVTSNRIIINLVDTDKNEYSAMVGDLLAIASTNKTEFTIASITDVSRTYVNNLALITNEQGSEQIDDGILNQIEATFLGSLSTVTGTEVNTFRRGIKCFPTLGNSVYTFSPNNLSLFMDSISHSSDNTSLTLGKYAIDSISKANLNGDRFFQRHAAILGSTGSGKSWLVSKLLEDANKLSFSNIIIFDIHGEYHPLTTDNGGFAKYLKIAGPSDTEINDKNLFIPYWLLNRDELQSILLDRADKDAPNQANRFNYHLLNLKKENAEDTVITVDSPIPFNLQELIDLLKEDDEKKVQGERTLKKGPWNGKLTRFIARLQSRIEDKRYGFMFCPPKETEKMDWAEIFFKALLETPSDGPGIKIIDFSEVPSDILPVITSTIGRLLFDIQSWIDSESRTPVSIICDEAHLYLPTSINTSIQEKQSVRSFERIAKEGRKYGLSLVVVSQRPADLNRTILSQCNNFIVLRLTNGNDQSTVKNLLPDSMNQLLDQLSLLDTGEAIVIGDSIIMPTKIILDKPKFEPDSKTKRFWQEWNHSEFKESALTQAVKNMRAQTFFPAD
ncbi:ATP-binding protein [Pediococcus acidilactici]|uniref:ATP-binding protein n=1 Tax=Pediococcus acidilactici TaxID=1254 RepID=UPI000FFE17E2|nr:ATP-binding protein [Pediococcus acidilactici]QAT21162.1 ATP-binding protein [Pediococcus acidilactici]